MECFPLKPCLLMPYYELHYHRTGGLFAACPAHGTACTCDEGVLYDCKLFSHWGGRYVGAPKLENMEAAAARGKRGNKRVFMRCSLRKRDGTTVRVDLHKLAAFNLKNPSGRPMRPCFQVHHGTRVKVFRGRAYRGWRNCTLQNLSAPVTAAEHRAL